MMRDDPAEGYEVKTSVQPKTNRASRRRRIGVSDGFGGLNFKPDPKLWEDLEAALGQPIPGEVQKDITDLVGEYYAWQWSEVTAPFRDDVQSYIAALRRDAIKLRDTIGQTDDFAKKGLQEVARHCKIKNVKAGLPQRDAIRDVLTPLINATSVARSKFATDDPGFREGESWNNMILSIRKLFERHGLPTGASQETDRATSSKFVMFVRALQNHFPEDLRRHDDAVDATLAKAINRLGKKRDNSLPK
jgi:hypothetical protein